jgi:hypothetical protein
MFIITYIATNNDTYKSREFTLQHPVLKDGEGFDEDFAEDYEYTAYWEKKPKNVKKLVENTYDGVWEPDLKSIKVAEVK